MKTILKYWLLVAIIITGLCGLSYAAIQQDIRQSANDPQIQLAEDAASKLAGGQPLQLVVPTEKVDIASSLAPYLVVFDANGNPIAASGQLDGQMPSIPNGIFDYVKQNGEDRLTWQPRPGVRSAIVVTQFKGATTAGFVLAGRSLREVEIRESNIEQLLAAGCIALLVVTLLATVLLFGKLPLGRKMIPGRD
ncbi:MAG TPA: hypothetical protein VGT82_00795 [Ktedonobacteraceae bacterium]|nr:hypothetical protein [Ktedonobacteraceae bacterium]